MPRSWTDKQERRTNTSVIRPSHEARAPVAPRRSALARSTRMGSRRTVATASRTSVRDMSSQRRGGKRSIQGPRVPPTTSSTTRYGSAISTASKMNKSQLATHWAASD